MISTLREEIDTFIRTKTATKNALEDSCRDVRLSKRRDRVSASNQLGPTSKQGDSRRSSRRYGYIIHL